MKPHTLYELGKWLLHLALALIVAGIVSPVVSHQGSKLFVAIFGLLATIIIFVGVVLINQGKITWKLWF